MSAPLTPEARLALYAKLLRLAAIVRDRTDAPEAWQAVALYSGAVADDLVKRSTEGHIRPQQAA